MGIELYIPEVHPGQAYQFSTGDSSHFSPFIQDDDAVERNRLKEALRGHLNILFRPRFKALWIELLAKRHESARRDATSDKALRLFSGWCDDGENQLLVVFAASCGLGLTTYDHTAHSWKFTELDWDLNDQAKKEGISLDSVTLSEALDWWTNPMKLNTQFSLQLRAAWKILSLPMIPRLLRRWSSEPCGFEHQDAHILGAEAGVDKHHTLAALAAATTVGAMRFTGRRWVPDIAAAAWSYAEHVRTGNLKMDWS